MNHQAGGGGSGAEHLPRVHEALDCIPSARKNQQQALPTQEETHSILTCFQG